MQIILNGLPLILALLGVVILFWPHKPSPNPDAPDHASRSHHRTWRQTLLALTIMALALVLSIRAG